jgi:3-phenylpropionate/cinnamic acid dioxygenase small subunit
MMLLDRTFDVSVEPVSQISPSLETLHGIQQFLFHEARLLDERKLDDWLNLWTPEGRYWAPRKQGQENPFDHVSLFWEDAMLREVRVRRVNHERNWSQQPHTYGSRLVGNVMVDGVDSAGRVIVRSSLQLTEYRTEARQLGATVFHKLVATESGGWSIYLKRVNLTNCESIFGMLDMHM